MHNEPSQLIGNFLPEQYKKDALLEINHNYLTSQFFDYKEIFKRIEGVVLENDFTLGKSVDDFEKRFAGLHKAEYAIGVGSGTDAIFLSLKALGIGPGDEVITPPFTFFATVGAIATTGATPVFVDIEIDGFDLNLDLIEGAITPRTRAIVPVHWAGRICDMRKLRQIADKYQLKIVEDACHAVSATRDGEFAGALSETACFSFHPLKNLNVWGDGGIILTNSLELSKRLKLLRNHGLVSRNECHEFAYNSRLDTVQAVIADYLCDKLSGITNARINNSKYLDSHLKDVPQIQLHTRMENLKEVYHLYSFLCEKRDDLSIFLRSKGIDAKIHYPTPLHLQPAASHLGYKRGDFPISERVSNQVLSLPVHEFISIEQLDFMVQSIKEFYDA